MAKAHFILILTLAAFRLFAQPSLPTTNRTFVPMANPYSGSWIYYTTDSVSGLGYLNGASIPYVTTASNGVVAYVNTATNGFVTAGITNGLATTNFVLSQNYVTATVTNGLASISYVNAATNEFVTATITNGLATTSFVTSQGYVTATVTNGLATVSYVNTATNYVLTNNLAQLNSASNALAGRIVAATNGFGSIVTHSASELRAVTIWSGTSANANIAKNKNFFTSPNNSGTISATSYASGGTSVPATRSITLTNLYVVISGAINVSSSTLTILTNGVETPISVSFSLLQTTGNDTTDSVTVPAGTEIGVNITTGTGTPAKWSWSFEGW